MNITLKWKSDRFYVFLIIITIINSCKTTSDKRAEGKVSPNENEAISITFNPAAGSKYYYDIVSSSDVKLDLNDNKSGNIKNTTVGVFYTFTKDSAGDFVIKMQYDKIKIYSKKDENETELDAANSELSVNPVERMLGILKNINVTATVTPAGAIKEIRGYQELSQELIAALKVTDAKQRGYAQTQCEQFVGGLVKTNLMQLFHLFPDSAVRVRDTWKVNISQGEEFGLIAKATFVFKGINNDAGRVSSDAEITSDSAVTSLRGQSVTSTLNGHQQGNYEVNIKTGMLIKNEVKTEVKGSLFLMGRSLPVSIETSISMEGKQVQ